MRKLLLRLWYEEDGYVQGPEWAFIATILVLGAITGAMASRQTASAVVGPPPGQAR